MKKPTLVWNALFLALIGFTALALYIETLAPGVLWGDSAKLTLLAFNRRPLWGDLVGGHVLHTLIAWHIAEIIHLGNYAQTINLVSAIFGSLTVVVATAIVLLISGSIFAATITGLSLMLSHTFWTYSVIAESYTLVTFFTCVMLFLVLIADKYHKSYLNLIAGLLGAVAMLANLLVVFALPGILIIAWQRSRSAFVEFLTGLLLGAIAFITLEFDESGRSTLISYTMGQAHTFLHPARFFKEFLATFVYIIYQFPSLALLYVVISISAIKRKSTHIGLWGAVLGVVLFASTYQYQRHFVLLIMAYCFFAMLIGLAVAESNAFPTIKRYLLLPSVIIGPPLVYLLVPILAGRTELVPARPLPGRDNAYFLSPWKQNRSEPAKWAKSFLRSVEKRAVIYADFTPSRVLQYVQTVDGIRPDVSIIEIDKWISSEKGLRAYRNSICEQLAGHRTAYLAQRYEPYYKMAYLHRYFRLEEFLDGMKIISAASQSKPCGGSS